MNDHEIIPLCEVKGLKKLHCDVTVVYIFGGSLQLVIGGKGITKCKLSWSQKHPHRKNKGEHVV